MKIVIIGTLMKWASVFIIILIIVMGFQFTIRATAVNTLVLMRTGPTNSAEVTQWLGLDRPFVPDFWPFDDQSLWAGEKTSLFSGSSSSLLSSTIVWLELTFFILCIIFLLQTRKVCSAIEDHQSEQNPYLLQLTTGII